MKKYSKLLIRIVISLIMVSLLFLPVCAYSQDVVDDKPNIESVLATCIIANQDLEDKNAYIIQKASELYSDYVSLINEYNAIVKLVQHHLEEEHSDVLYKRL